MSFLLDTDICSAYPRGDRRLFHRFMQHVGGIHVSAISVAELFTWVSRANSPSSRREGLEAFIRDATVLDVGVDVARMFGGVRAALLDQGRPTPTLDLLIACTALVHDLTLVTHNTQDFTTVPGLRVQDWLAP